MQFECLRSRVSCLLLVAIGVLWVPIIQNVAGSQLFTYMQQVQNILSPPVSAVFLLAVFWPRTNEPVRHIIVDQKSLSPLLQPLLNNHRADCVYNSQELTCFFYLPFLFLFSYNIYATDKLCLFCSSFKTNKQTNIQINK